MSRTFNQHNPRGLESAYYGLLLAFLSVYKLVPFTMHMPQLRLQWYPGSRTAHACIPDLTTVIAALGQVTICGGVEQKGTFEGGEFDSVYAMTCIQSEDQAKATYRNNLADPIALLDGIPWLVTMGLQVSLRVFGPFSAQQLHMRGHHPNADSMGTEVDRAMLQHQALAPAPPDMPFLGTVEAQRVLYVYLEMAVGISPLPIGNPLKLPLHREYWNDQNWNAFLVQFCVFVVCILQ